MAYLLNLFNQFKNRFGLCALFPNVKVNKHESDLRIVIFSFICRCTYTSRCVSLALAAIPKIIVDNENILSPKASGPMTLADNRNNHGISTQMAEH